MAPYLLLGVLFLVAGLALFLAKKREKRDYDERQLLEQGKAGKLAFWVTVIGLILYYVFAQAAELRLAEEGVAGALIAVLGILVFGVYSLARDAYFARGRSPIPLIVLFALNGALDFWNGIRNILSGEMIVNGLLSYRAVYLACGATFLILAAGMLVKTVQSRREERE